MRSRLLLLYNGCEVSFINDDVNRIKKREKSNQSNKQVICYLMFVTFRKKENETRGIPHSTWSLPGGRTKIQNQDSAHLNCVCKNVLTAVNIQKMFSVAAFSFLGEKATHSARIVNVHQPAISKGSQTLQGVVDTSASGPGSLALLPSQSVNAPNQSHSGQQTVRDCGFPQDRTDKY